MYALFKKEINNFLSSLIGIMVVVVFLLITGLFLWVFKSDFNIMSYGYANLDGLFILAPWVFLFLVPAVTMRFFAEERRTGTIEMLLTKPLSDWQIVGAKYLAGVTLVLLALIPTLIYYLTVSHLAMPAGNVDHGGIWGSYIGLFFLSAAFVSIGVFCSSVTNNQILAFILSVFLCGFLYIGFEFIYSLSLFGKIDLFIQQLGMAAHYSSMSRGVIDTRDLLYFLAIIALFLCLTKSSLASRKNNKRHEAKSLITTLIIIVLANITGSYVYTRFDLTSEKRYTLSDTSKDILKNLDDYVYFRVYLEGDFPAGFKKLRKETKEMLDEFRAYSKFIDYEFINPSESNDQAERQETYKILWRSGLNYYTETVQTNNGMSQIMIWPGIIMSYHENEMGIDLLSGESGQSQETVLNNSAQDLEYKLISAIKDISTVNRKTIAFVDGHGELADLEVYDIANTLSKKYNIKRTTLNEQLNSLMRRDLDADSNIIIKPAFDAVIMAKPTEAFSEKDKFIIDQYIMYGGKVMWLLDAVNADMDSLQNAESTMGLALNLNLDDQLFKYGVKINRNLLLAYPCAQIGLVTGEGASLQSILLPWYYFPLLGAASEHPIVRNLEAVKADFVSSLEPTTSAPEIQKIPLLKTSDYTKVSSAPVYISLDILNERPNASMFPQKGMPTAFLLNGRFTSLFENRMPASLIDAKEIGFKTQSEPNSMIVIADGDIIRNQLAQLDYAKKNNKRVGQPLPLGYDQYTNNTYGNKQFIENAVSYLLEGEGLLNVRTRELKIRLLDMNKVNSSPIKWQLINVVLPSAIMIVLGIVLAFLRKKKYEK
ncbi:MAG: gliding motility-associated ABC transporter substrate-binding protein GldG [Bacteroidales bacterium]|nr:gliding motility-associated ABC transporter substrate-binding protein GldG [Bacteroidales bacterium]